MHQLRIVLVVVLLTTSAVHAQKPVRRGALGIVVKSPADTNIQAAEVALIEIGSSAYQSDLRAGDMIVEWDNRPVRNPGDFVDNIDRVRGGQAHHLRIIRDGQRMALSLNIVETPREQDTDQVAVTYSWFKAGDGTPLRGVLTAPRPAKGRLPLVVMLLDSGGTPCDDPDTKKYVGAARALAREGFAVLRWDYRGSGDSYGTAYSEVGFDQEVQDGTAMVRQAMQLPIVDPTRVYVLGWGTGGVIAAHVVTRVDGIAGLIVWGTVSRPLVECLLESARTQGTLAGLGAPEINRQVRLTIRFYERMLAGEDPLQIVSQYPQLKQFVGSYGHVLGKTAAYWRDFDSTLYWKLYGQSNVPTLALHAQDDFIASETDSTNIVALAVAAGRGDVHAVSVPGTDHDMNTTTSKADSFARLRERRYEFDAVGVEALTKWISKLESWRSGRTGG